jgi:hypothetical protein
MFGEQPQIGARRGPFDVWHGRFLAITYAAFHRDLLKNESGGDPNAFCLSPCMVQRGFSQEIDWLAR